MFSFGTFDSWLVWAEIKYFSCFLVQIAQKPVLNCSAKETTKPSLFILSNMDHHISHQLFRQIICFVLWVSRCFSNNLEYWYFLYFSGFNLKKKYCKYLRSTVEYLTEYLMEYLTIHIWQSRKTLLILIAYCPNIYIVTFSMNFHFSHFVQSFWVFSVKTPGVKAAVVKQRLTVGSRTRGLESPRNTNQLSISSLFSVCTVCSFPRQACAEGFFYTDWKRDEYPYIIFNASF